jgi:hypothetical protein
VPEHARLSSMACLPVLIHGSAPCLCSSFLSRYAPHPDISWCGGWRLWCPLLLCFLTSLALNRRSTGQCWDGRGPISVGPPPALLFYHSSPPYWSLASLKITSTISRQHE